MSWGKDNSDIKKNRPNNYCHKFRFLVLHSTKLVKSFDPLHDLRRAISLVAWFRSWSYGLGTGRYRDLFAELFHLCSSNSAQKWRDELIKLNHPAGYLSDFNLVPFFGLYLVSSIKLLCLCFQTIYALRFGTW